ncbi:MAG: GMC family oxidoreductase N-terminal domain-containing protein [Leptospirales bacterium]|nr:GMC family oxidoreductase N-terminal domain-containing protein [Leptospirales bacterium]
MNGPFHLSAPSGEIQSLYDVVVIGSGYGGSVAALRSTEAGLRVAVLEKGHEYPYANFPDSVRSFLRASQVNGSPNEGRLFDFRVFRDLNILTGSGLGGGSLINAGVMMRPSQSLFDGKQWPAALKGDAKLDRAFDRARAMLNPAPYPVGKPGYPLLDKTRLLKGAAKRLGYHFEPVNLTIRFEPAGENAHGAFQDACQNCGNCLTGCNHGAKNSLDKNYLYRARSLGAHLFTGIRVSHIQKRGDEYLVYYQPVAQQGTYSVIRAKQVFLGAGSLGSTEILLRSRELGGLALSSMLGKKFSANSGRLGGIYNGAESANMVGLARNVRADRRNRSGDSSFDFDGAEKRTGSPPKEKFTDPIGPTITACLESSSEGKSKFLIEDAAAPGASSSLFPIWWTLLAAFQSGPAAFGNRTTQRAILRSLFRGPYAQNGAIRNTGLLLAVGHDDAGGRLRLSGPDPHDGRVDLLWPGAGLRENYLRIDEAMRQFAESANGHHNTNQVFPMNPITVHPLGGCGMANSSDEGVVNHRCEVFDPSQGRDSVHSGLFVVDGAAMPGALGINPLWTISAIAERALELAIGQKTGIVGTENVEPDTQASKPLPTIPLRNREGIITAEVTEELQGHWAPGAASCNMGMVAGRQRGLAGQMILRLQIQISDVEEFLIKPEHEARVVGEIDCPALDLSGPLPIVEGSLRLFERSQDAARNRFMHYELITKNAQGSSIRITGEKAISSGQALQALRELTQLDVIVESGQSGSRETIGRGIVTVDLGAFLKSTVLEFRSSGGGAIERLLSRLKVYGFFAGECLDAYAPKFVRSRPPAIPAKSPIERHSLSGIRYGTVTKHPFLSGDGLGLTLTRVVPAEPARAAVLLIHGLTSSSDMYIMPEHDNLTNFLTKQGYEVWLLDSRMSNRFDYNTQPHNYTFDDVALFDMVPAVKSIRDMIPEAAKLHVVAHCLGSLSFSLGLFGGMFPEHSVQSVITNSVSLNVQLPFWSALKMQGLLESGFLEDFQRIDRMAPDAISGKDWALRFIAKGISRLSHECDNPYCHSLSFMWGAGPSAVFQHENLLPETHNRLQDLFGPTTFAFHRNVMALHRAAGRSPRIGRKPHLNHLPDDYLESARKNSVPVLFMRGDENNVFGQSQDVTYRSCSKVNPGIYRHAIIKGYGHQDVFMGKHSATDVFPEFIRFWNLHSQENEK